MPQVISGITCAYNCLLFGTGRAALRDEGGRIRVAIHLKVVRRRLPREQSFLRSEASGRPKRTALELPEYSQGTCPAAS